MRIPQLKTGVSALAIEIGLLGALFVVAGAVALFSLSFEKMH